ncbi:MAG: hypothetical protein SO131_04790 [Prevotella sp.]|nr:hypothetical protein [Prevotella sp.]
MKKLLILLACVTVALSSMAGDIIVKPVYAHRTNKETNWGGSVEDIKANEAYKMKLVPGTQNLYTCTIHLNKYFKTNKWDSKCGDTYADNEGWSNVHKFACVNIDAFGALDKQDAAGKGSAISAAQEFTIYNEDGEDVTFYAMVDADGKVHSYCNKQKLMLNFGPIIGGKPDSDLKISEYFTIAEGSVKLKITSNQNYYWPNDKASNSDYSVTTFGVGKATLDLKTFKFTIENNIFDTPLTVTSAGASTLVLPYEATIPEGVKAYTLTNMEGEATAIATELKTGSIPANTPVLINAAAGTYNFHGEKTTWAKEEQTVGALTSVRTCKEVPAGSYVLQNHNGQVGFYKVVKEKSVMIGANRAYFTPSVATAAAKINIEYPTVTGITSIKTTSIENDVMYNLAGQKVGNDYRGIVIKNGYKFFNK